MNRTIRRKNSLSWLGGICLLSATITACSGGSGGSDDDCSVAGINRWVDASMRDTYIYYDQVPELNLDDYTDPAELVRDLRVAPDIYSSVVDAASDEQIIGNSSVTRFGFWLQEASDGRESAGCVGYKNYLYRIHRTYVRHLRTDQQLSRLYAGDSISRYNGC